MSVDDPGKILDTLRKLASEKRLQDGASLSKDGETLTADGISFAARTKLSISFGDKSCSYTAASVYLQIIDLDVTLVKYRRLCKDHQVNDPIPSIDKEVVVGYFFGATEAPADVEPEKAAEVATAPAPEGEAGKAPKEGDKRESRKDREHRHHKSSSSHRKESSSSKRKRDRHSDGKHRDRHDAAAEKKRKAKTTVTNEEMLGNLDDMVGKRSTDPSSSVEADKAVISAALSADGFEITPELLEKHREATEYLMANEIPVGDSASILRAANPRKDLSRVLEIFLESVDNRKAKESTLAKVAKKAEKAKKNHLIGKKPVIVVPKGMTAPVILLNAHEFLANGRYVPRDVLVKQQRQRGMGNLPVAPITTFTRQVSGTAAATNPGQVEYEITDNPKRLLGMDPANWDRIVAVFVLGQKWQFADWLKDYRDPVHLFNKTFGFYVSLEGDKIPEDVQGWAVRRAVLNRDKRGLDSVSSAAFWNGLDEFMSVHKRELLPQPPEE
eukprot:scaffold212_cov173-Amphora_coffeaeformis.AAC.8